MQVKKEKNKYRYLWLALTCLAVLCFLVPESAHAYFFTSPNLVGNGQICPGNGLTRRIVPCIQDTFLNATNNFLVPFSAFIADTVTAACVLAVILWGAKMASGVETAPLKDSMVGVLKIAFVIMFTTNFGNTYDNAGNLSGGSLDPTNQHNGNFGLVLDIMNELLTMVTGYVIQSNQFSIEGECQQFNEPNQVYLVWDAVDCAIETLVGGIYSSFTISWGIMGFLTACLFSNTIGFSIGMIGLYLIYKFVYAIIKCVYIFLSAYMGVSFMVIISPMFIPLILFKATKSYFDRWLKLFTSFIIQPMVMFAYLAMLLAAFDTVVFSTTNSNSLYQSIAGSDKCFGQPSDQPCGVDSNGQTTYGSDGRLGLWMLQKGFYTNVDKNNEAIGINNQSIKNSGLVPQNVQSGGATGDVPAMMENYLKSQQNGVMSALGVGGSNPNFFQIAIPTITVSWTKLAMANGYDGSSPDKSTTAYILKVLVSAFMALLTGYIFVSMLDAIPMIGSGMANYGKPGDAISASLANRNGGGGLGSGGGGGGFASQFGFG